jgi:hypothetical protein
MTESDLAELRVFAEYYDLRNFRCVLRLCVGAQSALAKNDQKDPDKRRDR